MDTCPLPVISFNKKLKADSLTPELLYLYLQPHPFPLHKWRGIVKTPINEKLK